MTNRLQFGMMIVALVVILGMVSAGATASAVPPAEEMRVIDQREIVVSGFRLIEMSPDGQWLAAMTGPENTDTDDPLRVCAIRVDDSAKRHCASLDRVEAGIWLDSLVWSPDSTRFAFAEQSFVRFVDGDLWVFEVATGSLRNVTDDGFSGRLPLFDDQPLDTTAHLDIAPAWSPDSSEIAFARSTLGPTAEFGTTIMRMPASGGEVQPVIEISHDVPGVVYIGLRWTPDGTRLIYPVAYVESDHSDNGVWSVDIDGGNSRQLTHADRESGPAIPLSINASGDTMLVVYPNLLRFGGAERSSYGLVNLPSGKTEAIEIGIPDQTGIGRPLTATLSPDGAHLIYVTRLTVPEHRVVVRDLATGTDQIAMYSLLDAVTLGIDSGLTWASNQTIFVPTGLDRGVVLTLGSDATSPQTPVPPMLMTPSPITASPTAPALAIEEGATVVVNDDNVNLRAGPAIDAPIIALLARGTELIVIGPAETGDGFVWWPVRDPSSRQIGFVRAEFLFRLGGR